MIKKFLGLVVILLSTHSIAQKNNTSPYSFFGIGEETNYKTVEEIQMGEIGTAYNSPYQFTFSNPASLASLRLTTYTIAGESKTLNLKDGNESGTASSTSLSYLALGFPIGNKAGFSFGLQPNTTVGYSLVEKILIEDNFYQRNLYQGEGGTNRVFLSFGYKILKNVNFGLEASYIFGNIENTLFNYRFNEVLINEEIQEEIIQHGTIHKTESTLRGSNIRTGIQYQTKINDKLTLRTGGVFSLSNDLKNEGEEYLYSVNLSQGFESPRDTIVNKSFKSTVKKPLKTSFGIGLGEENKWYAGMEFSFQNALEFTDDVLASNTIVEYDKSNKVSFGGFYTPKFNSISSYWERITYRAGLKFKNTGLIVNNTTINDFGISFGVGLPIGQQLSKLNMGFELGKRGEINNTGLVKENYFNFRLSLTLTDRWFQKRTLN